MITKELWQKIVHGTVDERIYLTKRNFEAFLIYYFSDYFDYQIPAFHQLFFDDLQRLAKGDLNEAAWIAFAESAKTTIAKIGVQWLIAGKDVWNKRYINWDSWDRTNPESALFDITVSLQTNQKLRDDFGDLYIEKRSSIEKTQKQVSSFITSNRIKVEAFTVGTSPRGRVYNKFRPDVFIFDDIENVITRRSAVKTKNIVEHYNEVKRGLSGDAFILVLGNFITETGVIAHIMNRMEANPRGIVRNIPVMDKKTKDIAWKSKYVMTDKQASKANTDIDDRKKQKISLESKKRDLGEISYNENMMNDPIAAGLPFFDRRKIDAALEKVTEPLQDLAGFRLWLEYNPSHRYTLGADTSMGVGRDSCASALLDASVNPNVIGGSYANNRIKPNIFAHELKREGDLFGSCLIAVETNAESGGTCVNELSHTKYKNIYTAKKTAKGFEEETEKMGWESTGASVPEALFQFKSAFEDGSLEVMDPRILQEMKKFMQTDIDAVTRPATVVDTGIETTRHFDLLRAAVIAYAVRNSAKVEKKKSTYVQPPYESPSLSRSPLEQQKNDYEQPPYESPSMSS